MILPRAKQLRAYSTRLRKEATPQENRLWYDYLRTYPMRFNRQRIIGAYIVDFYCAKANLAIELDSGQHYEARGIAYDAARTQYLSSVGVEVLRFTNLEIKDHFTGVCEMIDHTIKTRTNESTRNPPTKAEATLHANPRQP